MFALNEIIAAKDLGLYRGRRNVLEMKKSADGTETFKFTITKYENDTDDNPETTLIGTSSTDFRSAYNMWQSLLDIFYCGHARGFEFAESLR